MFLVYSAIVYGITNIITQSTIFEPLRDFFKKYNDFLGSLFSCPMCMGFWVGAALSLCNISPALNFFDDAHYITYLKYILDGGMASGIAWVMHTFVTLMHDMKLAQIHKIEQFLEDNDILND